MVALGGVLFLMSQVPLYSDTLYINCESLVHVSPPDAQNFGGVTKKMNHYIRARNLNVRDIHE